MVLNLVADVHLFDHELLFGDFVLDDYQMGQKLILFNSQLGISAI